MDFLTLRRGALRLSSLLIIFVFIAAIVPDPAYGQARTEITDGPAWVLVASNESVTVEDASGSHDVSQAGIYLVNTWSDERRGPYLVNELMSFTEDEEGNVYIGDSNIFDMAITPDEKTVLVSDFGNSRISFLDVSNPIPKPVYLGAVYLDMFAEDIAITADGKYALVSDGGYSPLLIVIDITQREVIYQMRLPFYGDPEEDPLHDGDAQAVAVSADGTVIVADYMGGVIHFLTIDGDGRLTYFGHHQFFLNYDGELVDNPGVNDYRMWPINVAIAPDGETVLVSNAFSYTDPSLDPLVNRYCLGVYHITAPGVVEFAGVVTDLPRAMQSIAFDDNGDKAYMYGNNGQIDCSINEEEELICTILEMDGLYVLDILGPGQVSFNPGETVELTHNTSGQFFGVDTILVYDQKAYLSYPTNFIDNFLFPERTLSVVDLNTSTLTDIPWGLVADGVVPLGMAGRHFIPIPVYLPLVVK